MSMNKEQRNVIPSDKEITEGAENWVFEINGMKWSNNDDTAGDNFASFIAGAKWALEHIKIENDDKISW